MRVLWWQLAWMVAVILSLSILGTFSYELFFVLSVLGFLIAVDLTQPIAAMPEWWLRARSVLALGLLGFALVVVRRLVEMMESGIAV